METLEETQKRIDREKAEQVKEWEAHQAQEEAKVAAMRRKTDNINADTDHTDDESAEGRPTEMNTPNTPPQPTAGAEQPAPQAEAPAPAPEQPTPQAETPAPEQAAPQPPIAPQRPTPQFGAFKASTGSFEADSQSFFNPETENGFLDTMNKLVEKGLQGNSPEEIAQNMFFTAMTALFELLAKAIEHRTKERKRRRKEYQERTRLWDKEVAGMNAIDKANMFWGVMSTHPMMAQYLGKSPLPKEAKKAALQLAMHDKQAHDSCKGLMEVMLKRQLKESEYQQMVKSASGMILGSMGLEQVGKLSLNNPKVLETLNTAGQSQLVGVLHDRVASHRQYQAEQAAKRQTLNRARGGQGNDPNPYINRNEYSRSA